MAALSALTKIAVATLPIAALALFVWRSDGYAARVPVSVRIVESEVNPDLSLREKCFGSGDITQPCLLGGKPGKISMILIGDSQALALAPAIRQAMPAEFDGALYFRAHPACGTVIGGGNPHDDDCLKFNMTYIPRLLSDELAGIPVVIVNLWQGAFISAQTTFTEYDDGRIHVIPFSPAEYQRRATDTICRIGQKHPLFIVSSLPEWDYDVAPRLARRLMLRQGAADVTQTVSDHLAHHSDAVMLMDDFEKACKVKILNPVSYLCPDGTCPASDAGHPLYYDRRHLNDAGSNRLVPMFTKAFNAIVREQGPSR